MTLAEFIAWHMPALAKHEVRHGLMLNALKRASAGGPAGLEYWTLGAPGQCAVRMAGRSIILGDVDEGQCRVLAGLTQSVGYPGVIGPDLTARWFTDRARELGVRFHEPERQGLHALSGPPRYPAAPGYARAVTHDDAALFADWAIAFHREAIPRDPVPSRDELERRAGEGDFLLWIDDERPVSMAGIVRPLRNSAAITYVYTPPAARARGYAGSVTAAAVERIQAGGRRTACLFTDLDNPFSNRCYAKIGFLPVCGALHFHRDD